MTTTVKNPPLPHASLEDKLRKARYGVSYVRNVCSQAGVPFAETEPDSDVLAVDGLADFPEGPVRVQVKCTSQRKMLGTSASWKLDPQWVRKWEASEIPVYFVLVIVPDTWTSWVTHSPSGTLHSTGAFWRRVDFGVDVTKQLKIDKTNRLTMDTLSIWHKDLLSVFGRTI